MLNTRIATGHACWVPGYVPLLGVSAAVKLATGQGTDGVHFSYIGGISIVGTSADSAALTHAECEDCRTRSIWHAALVVDFVWPRLLLHPFSQCSRAPGRIGPRLSAKRYPACSSAFVVLLCVYLYPGSVMFATLCTPCRCRVDGVQFRLPCQPRFYPSRRPVPRRIRTSQRAYVYPNRSDIVSTLRPRAEISSHHHARVEGLTVFHPPP